MEAKRFNCLIYGASGAVGRMLTKHCFDSDRWGQVFIVTRRNLPMFDEMKSNPEADSLRVILTQDIMDENKIITELNGSPIHCVFNMLGSRTGRGKDLFVQIDKTFVVNSCNFAHKLNALLFSHVTSQGSNKDSMFFYMKIKGQCEEELKATAMKHISIHRPGLIEGRENDARCGEKIMSFVPFISKIKATNLAKAVMNNALRRMDKILSGDIADETLIYEHKQIEKMLVD